MNQLHVTTDVSSDRRTSNLHPSATKHGTKAMRRFWMEAKTGCRVVWKRCSSCLRIGLAHRSAPLGQGCLGQARPVWGNLFGNAAISSFATFRTRASCLSLRLSGSSRDPSLCVLGLAAGLPFRELPSQRRSLRERVPECPTGSRPDRFSQAHLTAEKPPLRTGWDPANRMSF